MRDALQRGGLFGGEAEFHRRRLVPTERARIAAGDLAERVVAAMTGALPAEAAAMAGPLAGVMGQMGGVMFGAQVGQGYLLARPASPPPPVTWPGGARPSAPDITPPALKKSG